MGAARGRVVAHFGMPALDKVSTHGALAEDRDSRMTPVVG